MMVDISSISPLGIENSILLEFVLKSIDFLDFNILDIIDIVLVAMLLYYAYRLVKGTAAINIFVGIVIAPK